MRKNLGYTDAIPGIIVLFLLSIPFMLLGMIFNGLVMSYTYMMIFVCLIGLNKIDNSEDEKPYYLTLNPFCNPYIYFILSGIIYILCSCIITQIKQYYSLHQSFSKEAYLSVLDNVYLIFALIQHSSFLIFIFYRRWLKKNEIIFHMTLSQIGAEYSKELKVSNSELLDK